MKYIFDEDSAKDAKVDETMYNVYQQEEKNRILRMTNPQRKQEQWKLLFPPLPELSEDLVF